MRYFSTQKYLWRYIIYLFGCYLKNVKVFNKLFHRNVKNKIILIISRKYQIGSAKSRKTETENDNSYTAVKNDNTQ